MGDHYGLKVVRSSIGEVVGDREVDGGSWDFNAEASAGLGGEFGAKVKVFGWELAEWKYPFDIGKQKPIFKYPEE